MKKLFILTSILALASLSSMAQGYINANNQGTTTLITVSNPSINGGASVSIGNPATAAGFGAGEGKGAVTITLYAAQNGTALSTLETQANVVFTGLNSASGLAGNQGTVNIGNPFTLPTSQAFSGAVADEFIAYAVSGDGLYTGWSTEATGLTPATAGSGATAPSLFGNGAGQISSFALLTSSPEPSTIALGGLGAAALLAFRRRK